MLFTRIPSGHAQTETYKNVDSTLYAYYRWCNNNIRDSVVLLKADTLFRLAGEKNDIRMQAVALSFKADHYYVNNELDSLKAWIPACRPSHAQTSSRPTIFSLGRGLFSTTRNTGNTRWRSTSWNATWRRPNRTTTSPPSPKPTSS